MEKETVDDIQSLVKRVEYIILGSKLEHEIMIDQIGSFKGERMGKIQWPTVKECEKTHYSRKMLKIRKMIPKLDEHEELPVLAMLLLDFVHMTGTIAKFIQK